MAKIHVVKLGPQERVRLQQMIRTGHDSARRLGRARVLLKADEGKGDREVAAAVAVSVRTAERTRKRFCKSGIELALSGNPPPGRPSKRKIDGEIEAKLVTLACSTPPQGHDHWTMQMLADRMLHLKYVDGAVSDETVRRTLKKTGSNHG